MSTHFTPSAYKAMRESADRHGIPYSILKTAIAMESSGVWREDMVTVPMERDGKKIRLFPYTGMTDADAESLGYDPDDVSSSQELQIDVMAARLAYLKLSLEWQGVFAIIYQGMQFRDAYTANAMTFLKQSMGEQEVRE